MSDDHKFSPYESLEEEMAARTAADGIPRHITDEGRIMKMDWELDLDDLEEAISGEQLEEHIQNLLREQLGNARD